MSDTPPKRLSITGASLEDDLSDLQHLLTPRRLELWRIVRDEKPESITELSKRVDRQFKSVQRDLKVLAENGLIRFEQKYGAYGAYQKPVSIASRIEVEVG